jgi:hypothetical protein
MKTTLEIDETVMRELKARAAREGSTMSEVVESALRTYLAAEPPAQKLPPLETWDFGGWNVDPADREAMGELIDGERDEELYGIPRKRGK